MKDQDQVERRILDHARWIQAELGLEWLEITHKFNTRLDGDRVTAETSADWEYRQGSIHWSLPTVAVIEDELLDATIIHEYVHFLTAPVWSELDEETQSRLHKLNEMATEDITRAIKAVRKAK